MHPILVRAGKVAIGKDQEYEQRNFLLGCIGVRNDGTKVSARNGAVIASSFQDYRIISDAHAEIRCLKKMDRGGTLYVSRVLKRDGTMALSRPCGSCRMKIKTYKIERVFYTIDEASYGIWYPTLDIDKIFDVQP